MKFALKAPVAVGEISAEELSTLGDAVNAISSTRELARSRYWPFADGVDPTIVDILTPVAERLAAHMPAVRQIGFYTSKQAIQPGQAVGNNTLWRFDNPGYFEVTNAIPPDFLLGRLPRDTIRAKVGRVFLAEDNPLFEFQLSPEARLDGLTDDALAEQGLTRHAMEPLVIHHLGNRVLWHQGLNLLDEPVEKVVISASTYRASVYR